MHSTVTGTTPYRPRQTEALIYAQALSGFQASCSGAIDRFAGGIESGTMTGAIPGILSRIVIDDAALMRTDSGEFVKDASRIP